jgi:hypothetical protein
VISCPTERKRGLPSDQYSEESNLACMYQGTEACLLREQELYKSPVISITFAAVISPHPIPQFPARPPTIANKVAAMQCCRCCHCCPPSSVPAAPISLPPAYASRPLHQTGKSNGRRIGGSRFQARLRSPSRSCQLSCACGEKSQ